MRFVRSVGALVALLMASGVWGATVVVGDSVAEFSGTQGSNNWFYGYYDGLGSPNPFDIPDFNFWSHYVIGWSGQAWARSPCWQNSTVDCGASNRAGVDALGGWRNPGAGGGANGPWQMVRRWVAEVDGTVTVSGTYRSRSDLAENALVKILHSQDSGLPGDVRLSNIVPNENSTITAYSFVLNVGIGDTLDFVMANNPYGVDFNALITTAVPVPASVWLFGSALGLLGWVRWRKAT